MGQIKIILSGNTVLFWHVPHDNKNYISHKTILMGLHHIVILCQPS